MEEPAGPPGLRPPTAPVDHEDTMSPRKGFYFDRGAMTVVYHQAHPLSSSRDEAKLDRTQSTGRESSHSSSFPVHCQPASNQLAAPSFTGEPSDAFCWHRLDLDHPNRTHVLHSRVTTTTTTSVYEPTEAAARPSRRNSTAGLDAGSVVGALLGVAAGAAAGAALTLKMVQKERSRALRQEFDAPPSYSTCTRRSEFPDGRNGRVVEVERTVEWLRYPDDCSLVTSGRRPPDYVGRYGHAGSPLTRAVDEFFDDRRSRLSTRSRPAVRTQSETGSSRRPLLLADAERGSQASVKSAKYPPVVQRNYTYNASESGSGVSARSHRSPGRTTTARPASRHREQLVAVAKVVDHSRKYNKDSSSSSRPASRPDGHLSARHIPFPPRITGRSRVDWDDGECSIAPSDSISNVDTRRGRRR